MIEVIKNIGTILGCIISLTTVISMFLGVFVKPFRQKIVNWIQKEAHSNELSEQLHRLEEKIDSKIGGAFDAREQGIRERDKLYKELKVLKSAQKTSLQTKILEKCKIVQEAINNGTVDYSEDLKQLIILYREYWFCKFNHQGKMYFDDTISKSAEHNNVLTHELMNTYFPEYDPDKHWECENDE